MRRRSAAGLLAALLILLAIWPAAALADASIGLSAGNFNFTAASGQIGKGVVVVSNEGSQPVSVRFYASDQLVDDKGAVTFVTPSVNTNTLQSPASWTTVVVPQDAKTAGNIPYMDMQPGAQVPVQFEVQVPDGATPGDHNIILFFETFRPPNAPPAPPGTNIFGRVGTRIKARVAGTIDESVEVAPFRMPSYVIGDAIPYGFTVTNSGNVDERIDAQLLRLDSSESVVSSTRIATDTPVYAGAQLQRAGSVKVSGTTIGPTHFKLNVTYPAQAPDAAGVTKKIEKERTVWVIPVWLVVGVAVVAFVLLGYAVWSAGRRYAESRARREPQPAIPGDEADGESWSPENPGE